MSYTPQREEGGRRYCSERVLNYQHLTKCVLFDGSTSDEREGLERHGLKALFFVLAYYCILTSFLKLTLDKGME